MAAWSNWSSRHPVTVETTGSNPVAVAQTMCLYYIKNNNAG